jgi:hypothetical protein
MQSSFVPGRRFRLSGRYRTSGWPGCAWIAVAACLFALLAPAPRSAVAGEGDCGQPVSAGAEPVASDALAILTAAVATEPACPGPAPGRWPLCRCDVNNSGTVTSIDALVVLRVAVGLADRPACNCPSLACGGDSCVFLSAEMPNGNTGGLAGSDALCDQAAADAGLGGSYRAWRSQNSPRIDAIDRLTEVGPWRRVDGALVAIDRADLVDGEIASPIRVQADGQKFDFLQWQATAGTDPDGTLYVNNGTAGVSADVTCNNWTSTDGDISIAAASWASPFVTSGLWSNAGAFIGCDAPQRMYCFETSPARRCTVTGIPVSQGRCRNASDCPVNVCQGGQFGTCSLTGFPCINGGGCAQTQCTF